MGGSAVGKKKLNIFSKLYIGDAIKRMTLDGLEFISNPLDKVVWLKGNLVKDEIDVAAFLFRRIKL